MKINCRVGSAKFGNPRIIGDAALVFINAIASEGYDRPSLRDDFSDALVKNIPLAAHIPRVLDERKDHRAPEDRFLQELEDYLTDGEAERVLETAITWGRYAEIFDYDLNSGVLMLPEEVVEEMEAEDEMTSEGDT